MKLVYFIEFKYLKTKKEKKFFSIHFTGYASVNGKNCPESKLHPEQGRAHVLEENLFNKYF
jgi:hypothetical protein